MKKKVVKSQAKGSPRKLLKPLRLSQSANQLYTEFGQYQNSQQLLMQSDTLKITEYEMFNGPVKHVNIMSILDNDSQLYDFQKTPVHQIIDNAQQFNLISHKTSQFQIIQPDISQSILIYKICDSIRELNTLLGKIERIQRNYQTNKQFLRLILQKIRE